MIAGTVIIEDVTIQFSCDFETGKTTGFVTEVQKDGNIICEQLNVDNLDFMKAMSIAIHSEGLPNWQSDYPAAERVMKPDGIRWIP